MEVLPGYTSIYSQSRNSPRLGTTIGLDFLPRNVEEGVLQARLLGFCMWTLQMPRVATAAEDVPQPCRRRTTVSASSVTYMLKDLLTCGLGWGFGRVRGDGTAQWQRLTS